MHLSPNKASYHFIYKQLADYPTFVQARSMSRVTLDELLESHEVLSLKLNELKSHLGRALDIMNILLSYHRPVVVSEVITLVHMPDYTPHQELPHGHHPQPRSPKVSWQSHSVPRTR